MTALPHALAALASGARARASAIRSGRARLLAPLGFVLAALVATWPLALHLGTHLPGTEARTDTLFQLVFSRWFAVALGEGTNPYRVWSVLFPVGSADFLGKNGTCLNALLSVPLQPLVGLIAAVNLTAILLLAFSGWATWRLARYLGTGDIGAALAGIFLVLAPYTQSMFSSFSLDQLSLGWALTFLLYLLRTLDEPGYRNPALAALFSLLTFLSFLGYGFLFAWVAVVVLLHFAATRWRDLKGALLRRMLALAFTSGALIAPVALAFHAAGGASAVDPAAAASFPLALAPSAATLASATNRIVLEHSLRWGGDAARIQVVTLALAATGALARGRRGGLWILLAAVFMVLAVGPYVHFGGAGRLEGGLWIPAPGLLLYRIGGAFARFRFPFRYAVVAWISVALLAGLGVRALAGGRVRSAARARAVGVVALALLLGETALRPLGMLPARHFLAPEVPAYFREILAAERDAAVLPVPLLLTKPSRAQEAAYPEPMWHPLEMYFQAFHGHRMLAGPEATVRPSPQLLAFVGHNTLVQDILLLQADPGAAPAPVAERDVLALEELGFGWVVVSAGWLPTATREAEIAFLAQLFGPPHVFPADRVLVFEVTSRGALRRAAGPLDWLHPRGNLAAGDQGEAERRLRATLKERPDDGASAEALLALLVRQRRWKPALEVTEALLRAHPGHALAARESGFAREEIALAASPGIDRCQALAAWYLEAGEPRRALACLEPARDRGGAEVRALLGRAYQDLGWPSLALAAYREALALDPDRRIDLSPVLVPAAEHPLASRD